MMGKLTAIDIGNTNITIGIFKGRRLVKKAKIPTHSSQPYEKSMKFNGRGNAIISSVVPPALQGVVKYLKRNKFKVAVVGKDIEVPIKNLYKKKSEVGQDRLVNAYATKVLYGTPAVVIDFGTAITFDVVSRKGEYLGGLILPGIEMGLGSLYEKTALLPKVELKEARHIIGKDTVDSMRGGILFGYGAMCDGLVQKYRKVLGANTRVMATGGNARLIKKYSKSIQKVDEDLTLRGLCLIWNSH